MWPMISIFMVALGIFFIVFPNLKKKNKKKDQWFFIVLLFFFTTISILESREVPLPNPLDLIQNFYKMF